MSRPFQVPGSMNDPQAPHPDGIHHRREPSARPRDISIRPLLTREPLPHDRERKQPSQPPKKRKRALPTKPFLTFNPKANSIPSGWQDPPASSPVLATPPASESFPSSFGDPPAPLSDHEIHDQVYDNYDAYKRARIIEQCPSAEYSTPSNPATPITGPYESNSVLPEHYDLPVSYTSPSSSASPDQSLCAAEYAVQVFACPVQGSFPMYPYANHEVVQQPPVYPDCYYPADPCQDRPSQGHSAQYHGNTYSGGGPYGDNNGYPYHSYPPHRY